MPVSMWFFLICGVIAVIAVIVALFMQRGDDKRIRFGGAGVVFLFALVFLAFASTTVVGTRQIGIETTFSRPTGTTLTNGLHLKAPWTEVTEMDGAVQIDQHTGDHRIKVRLGNSSTADADVSVRWQIKPDATPDLFVQYKTFDNVRSNLVTRNLQVALNEVFASFDPLAPQNLDRSPLPELSEKAKVILAAKVGDQSRNPRRGSTDHRLRRRHRAEDQPAQPRTGADRRSRSSPRPSPSTAISNAVCMT